MPQLNEEARKHIKAAYDALQMAIKASGSYDRTIRDLVEDEPDATLGNLVADGFALQVILEDISDLC